MSSEDNPKTPDESGNIRPEIQKKSEPEITKTENIGVVPKNEKLTGISSAKRSFSEVDGNEKVGQTDISQSDKCETEKSQTEQSQTENSQLEKDLIADNDDQNSPIKKAKHNRNINFGAVHVYSFPRYQGKQCVPSSGGSSLGMSSQHEIHHELTLDTYIDYKAGEKSERCTYMGQVLTDLQQEVLESANRQIRQFQGSVQGNMSYEEMQEKYNLFIAQHNNNAILQNYSAEDFYQLQPLAPKLRKRVLRDHGVGEIDPNEKLENRYLRASRQDCGCTCTDGCNPDTCSCYLEGIDCQVDREGFPCNCMIGACRNPKGQTLFDHKSVKEHYLKVLNRIPARYQHFQFQVQCSSTQQNATQQNTEQQSSQSSSSIWTPDPSHSSQPSNEASSKDADSTEAPHLIPAVNETSSKPALQHQSVSKDSAVEIETETLKFSLNNE